MLLEDYKMNLDETQKNELTLTTEGNFWSMWNSRAMFVERYCSPSLGHHVIVVIITITEFYDCVAFAISHSWLHYIDGMVWAEVTETISDAGLDDQKDTVAHVIVHALLTLDSDSMMWEDEFFWSLCFDLFGSSFSIRPVPFRSLHCCFLVHRICFLSQFSSRSLIGQVFCQALNQPCWSGGWSLLTGLA